MSRSVCCCFDIDSSLTDVIQNEGRSSTAHYSQQLSEMDRVVSQGNIFSGKSVIHPLRCRIGSRQKPWEHHVKHGLNT
ncbi:UNVERIFIED_CONTAM: hypothetical protein PYX00_008540 [Menopon gallinae]|uniref:Uncharacterized protein n=1 Tax=Menopon gallinae TaxID=328185 RepID=A0AAW2HP91_9NEOP